jgi:predicted RNase H-like nuclease (RuvC/YqgF family)
MRQYNQPTTQVKTQTEPLQREFKFDYNIRTLQEHVERQDRYIRRLQSELAQLRASVESLANRQY